MGFVCSLLFLAVTTGWIFDGQLGLKVQAFGTASEYELRRAEKPAMFWIVATLLIVAGSTAVVTTALGLRRVQRDEASTA